MKNILLPTDLTISSLYPIHEICRSNEAEKYIIRLIHTLDMPTGIADLLFLQQRKPYDKVPLKFSEALEMLRKKYAGVLHSLNFEFLFGISRTYLDFYMESRKIDAIHLLKDHPYENTLPQSVSCISTLLKSKIPVVYTKKNMHAEFGTLTTLLYKEKMPA